MNLNEPDPHTGYPMGSYRQDPTGRHSPLMVRGDSMEEPWWVPFAGGAAMGFLIAFGLWLGL